MLAYSTIADGNQGLQRYYQLEALSKKIVNLGYQGQTGLRKIRNKQECGMQSRHQHELQCIHKDTGEKEDKRITEAETPFEGQQ